MTKSTTAQIPEEAKITVEYGPVRAGHESRVLTALTEFNTAGLVFESSFETGKFIVCIEPDEYPDETLIREIIRATLNEAYGAVAVAKAVVTVDWS